MVHFWVIDPKKKFFLNLKRETSQKVNNIIKIQTCNCIYKAILSLNSSSNKRGKRSGLQYNHKGLTVKHKQTT